MTVFRDLYDRLLGYKGDAVSADVLLPALPDALAAMEPLRPYARRDAPTAGQGHIDALHQWYALSRVGDTLLLRFQSAPGFYAPEPSATPPGGWWQGPPVTADGYRDWFGALGFTPFGAWGQRFTPFHHEIVEIIEWDGLPEPATVDHVFWPGLTFGELLFSRAGVRVLCRPGVFDKDIAEAATLYFTYRRRWRRTEDPSHGWGHNSQWATSFRRDYHTGGAFHFNVDGDTPLAGADGAPPPGWDPDRHDGLTPGQAVELLVHRCLVRTSLEHDRGFYPYGHRFTVGEADCPI